MKQTIEDIRSLLKDGTFKDEQHVRFSLVGRLCQSLGWNIWNPEEFYTEYRVKRLPQQNITKDITGRVDVALFIPKKTSEGAEVFIEVKTPGKLDSDLIAGETQLHLYNAYHKSAISILTDGIKWRFYLPSAGGEFEDKLFNELNILEDDPDDIAQTFEMILKKENYRIKALNTAEDMRNELVRIKLIGSVKAEAINMHEKTDLSPYLFAQQLIKKNHRLDIDLAEIERLWDMKQSGICEKKTLVTSGIATNTGATDLPKDHHIIDQSDFSNTKPTQLYVIDKWYQVHNWKQVKKITYNALLTFLQKAKLSKWYSVSRDPSIFAKPIELDQGFFAEGNLRANNIVKHCLKAIEVSGFKANKDWRVETIVQALDDPSKL